MRSEVESAVLVPEINAQDHAMGPETAKVTLVEYGDYECPFCAKAHFSMKEIQAAMGDDLRFVFRNFPLSSIHPHAELAAEAAESAASQGKFGEMHDMLYENQDRLEPDDLISYAREIGLNPQRFTKDLAERRYREKIRRDFMSGIESGVNGTPTFFFNGIRYNGSYDPKTLLSALQGTLLY